MIIRTDKPLRKRAAYDFYPTPYPLASASLRYLPDDFTPEFILDPCAGLGVYGAAAKARYPAAVVAGMDIRGVLSERVMFMEARDAYALPRPAAYDYWQTGRNFLASEPSPVFDMVFSNPPYAVAEEFVRHGLAWLRPGGWLIYLLRLAFLEGIDRYEGLYQDAPPMIVGACVERPSFTGDDRTDATAYAVFVWCKGQRPPGDKIPLDLLSWKQTRRRRAMAISGERQLSLEGFAS